MPNGKFKIDAEHRFTCLEGKVDTILNNHLPHIQSHLQEQDKKLEAIDARVWWVLGSVILGTLITILLKYF